MDLSGLVAYGSSIYPGYQKGRMQNEQLLAAQMENQNAKDLRAASLASLMDAQGGDPYAATIAALSGNTGGGQPQTPGAPPSQGALAVQPGPQRPGLDASYQDPGMAQPPSQAGAPPQGGMPPQGAPPPGAQQPPQPGQPGSMQSPLPRQGGAPGMPSFGGGQMSLGQMLQRLKADPRNANIPDTTLLGIATKVQGALFPQDRMLLQFMMANQRNETTMRGQDMTAMYRDVMAQIAAAKADQPNATMIPGMGPPGADGKPTFGAYILDKKSGNLEFKPTGGAIGPQAVAAASGEVSDDTAKMIWDRLKAGDSTATQGLGTGMLGAKNRAKVYGIGQKEGASGTDLAKATLAFRGAQQAIKSVETQGAKIDVAANEMKEFGPLVIQSSDKIDRTKYPTLNKAYEAWLKGSGDEEIIRLMDSINAMQNAYAQVVTRGGQSTEGARHKAEEVLNAAWSRGQIKTGVDQLYREAEAAMRATSRVSGNVMNRVGGTEGGGQQSPASGAGAENDPLGIR